MATCTRCGKSQAAGFIDRTGRFVDTLSSEQVESLGFRPICRPCAAFQVAMSYDSSRQIGMDKEGNPEGDDSSKNS